MTSDPSIGLLYHWIGGLAAASFYLPYKAVRRWSWETYWLVGGFFSWIIAPLLGAALLVPGFVSTITGVAPKTLAITYMWGVLWGIGGLTFGLSVRYLGIALGYAVVLGMCAAFGTLIPPIYDGSIGGMFHDKSGLTTLGGIVICLIGIAISGMAGMSKEKELTDEQKRATTAEFNLVKGIGVALLSGLLSACFSFGLQTAGAINVLAEKNLLAAGKSPIWQGLPAIIVVLLGGFTTNFIWCAILNLKNKTTGQYIGRDLVPDAPDELRVNDASPSLLLNYFFSALAGVTWYFQFFFYTMGATKMGNYGFASWTLHMASIIIFSTLWGIALKEWRGTSGRTHSLIAAGLAVLIGSTVVIGYGTYLKGAGQ